MTVRKLRSTPDRFGGGAGSLIGVKVPAGPVKTPTCRPCRSSRTAARRPVRVSLQRGRQVLPAPIHLQQLLVAGCGSSEIVEGSLCRVSVEGGVLVVDR